MAADEVLALLRRAALTHQQVLKEMLELQKENERLNNLSANASPQAASPSYETDLPKDEVSVEEGHHALATPQFVANTAFRDKLRGNGIGSEPVPASNIDIDTGSILKSPGSTRSLASPPASVRKASQQWYVGEWVDLTGSFFNGALICVGENDWTPKSGRTRSQVTAEDNKYSMLVDPGANTISLTECRPDGQCRTYKAKPGPADTDSIIIWFGNEGNLKWTLKKQIDSAEHAIKSSLHSEVIGAALEPSLPGTTSSFSLGWSNLIDFRVIKVGMCGLIVCSMICLGIEIELGLPGRSASAESLNLLLIINMCILAAFIAEIGITAAISGWSIKKRNWFMANIFVTAIDAISLIIYIGSDRNLSSLRPFVLLRSVRLLRLAKFFENLGAWKVAWQLVCGLLSTVPTVAAMFVLLVLLLYAFACVGLEVLTKSDVLQGNSILQGRFDGLAVTMLTLFQFVTVDGFSDTYVSLIHADPLLLFYFMPIFLLVSISLMNMVTGVIVESAMSLASEQKDEERRLLSRKAREEVPIFREIFACIQGQGASVVCRKEFEMLKHEELPAFFRDCLTDFRVESMGEVFDLLDDNCDGELTEEQFVTGMLSLHLAVLRQEPCELMAIHKLVRTSAIKSRIVTKIIYEMDARQLQLSSAFEELRIFCTALANESASMWTSKPNLDPLSIVPAVEMASPKLEEKHIVAETVSSKPFEQLSDQCPHCKAIDVQLSQATKRVSELESELERYVHRDLKANFRAACLPSARGNPSSNLKALTNPRGNTSSNSNSLTNLFH